jgi:DNA replication protein DnaC
VNKITLHCEKHGDYEASQVETMGTVIESSCPTCYAEHEAEEAKQESEAEDARAIARAKAMNIRPEFYRASFDNFIPSVDNAATVEYTKQLVKGELLTLVFAGSCGTGKTHLACAALNAKRMGRIMTMYEISATIRASFAPRSTRTELEIVDELAEVPLLVIDEIGRTKGSDSEANWLSYILDKRRSSFLGSILISNNHFSSDCPKRGCPDCVENYFGADVISRISQKGLMVRFSGEDYRRKHT